MTEHTAMMQKIGDWRGGEVYQRDDGSFVFVDTSGEQREINEISGVPLMLVHFRWSSNHHIRPLEENEVPDWVDSTRWVLAAKDEARDTND